jgi:hypothetical protein
MARDIWNEGIGPRSTADAAAVCGGVEGQQLLPRLRRVGNECSKAAGFETTCSAFWRSSEHARKFELDNAAAEKRWNRFDNMNRFKLCSGMFSKKSCTSDSMRARLPHSPAMQRAAASATPLSAVAAAEPMQTLSQHTSHSLRPLRLVIQGLPLRF